MNFLIAFPITFVLCWLTIPALLILLNAINFFTTVPEGRYKVYMLFGRVLGVVQEPGMHFLWLRLGPQASLVRFFGKVYEIDARLDQEYLRSNPVNTEEGTPMGVGVWYEMRIKDAVDFLYKRAVAQLKRIWEHHQIAFRSKWMAFSGARTQEEGLAVL